MDASASRSQADLKFHNLKLIYSLIRNEGPVSRITLSKRAGLSATSMTRIINILAEMGLVYEHSIDSLSGIGRPATLLDICPNAAYCLCADMMINCCKVSLTNLQGEFVAYREIYVPTGMSFTALADEIAAITPKLAQEAGADPARIVCCGMSLTGHVLNETGFIVASSQFKWYQIDARLELENRLNMPVFVENDCKSALIGEESLLKKENLRVENIVYLQLGWGGVGSAAIVNGKLLRGSRNAAGEIGHFTVQPEGEVCNCGHIGCFETMISEQAVIRKAQKIDPSYNSMDRISAALEEGDAHLGALLDEVGEYIAIAINNLSCAYNPEIVILNGSLMMSCQFCYESAKKHLKVRQLESIQPKLTVRTAQMGANASLYGVGCIATEQAIDLLFKTKIRSSRYFDSV
jgi:predicted NBD/HSP70 family sugar kinase